MVVKETLVSFLRIIIAAHCVMYIMVRDLKMTTFFILATSVFNWW